MATLLLETVDSLTDELQAEAWDEYLDSGTLPAEIEELIEQCQANSGNDDQLVVYGRHGQPEPIDRADLNRVLLDHWDPCNPEWVQNLPWMQR